jgi:hypothetical protein
VVLQTIKTMVQNATFISISCDEVTTINNQSWIFVHVYVMKGFLVGAYSTEHVESDRGF